MKPWLKLGSVAVTLLFLAACSSDLKQGTTDAPALTTQAGQTFTIRFSEDDAEQRHDNGNTLTDDPSLELGERGLGPQTVGLRFRGINIPQGAKITDARLELTGRQDSVGSATLSIHGHASDNSPAYVAALGEHNIESRSKTTEDRTWIPGTLLAGDVYKPNVTGIVQEIVNRGGWKSGNALSFMIAGSGQRQVYSYDGSATSAPRLTVTFDTPPTVSESCLESTNPPTANPTKGVQYQVRGKGENAEIDASGKEFFVPYKDGSGDRPMRVQSNGSGLCISGGKYSTLVRDDAPWEPYYHFGPAIYAADSPNLTMENLTVHIGGDTIVIGGSGKGMNGWAVRDSYIRHAGDDTFQNDHKFSGLIDDVLVDWAYQGVSCDNKSILRTAGTVTIQDSLFALKKQKGTFSNFKDGTYPENPGHLYPFKWQSATGEKNNCKLRLRNTIFYMTQDRKVFDAWQDPREFVLECKNVTLVYVGGTTYKSDASRLAALRAKFKTINNENDGSCFKIQQGTVADRQAFWKAKRDDWFKRHSSNPQISSYRYQEPQGAN